MNYVYVRNIKNGREEFMRGFADTDNAIDHIARCYRIDKELSQLGEYYYFMVQH